jgi:radical SAM superfamily enzyme with C-terminal helix-hairpin-helix motif
MITILDCYTDEPAGLGVPPYLGTYPRYIAGSLEKIPTYLTIDDLRLFSKHEEQRKPKPSQKTDIFTYNLTKNFPNIPEILSRTEQLIIIAGVHTPGKYLSAVPGTLKEIVRLTQDLNCEKIITGPAVYGSATQGGKFSERADLTGYTTKEFDFTYDEIKGFAVKGTEIVQQIPDVRMIELETSKGCSRKEHCSFCTEPLKNKLAYREKDDIVEEVKAFNKQGITYFRLGKQSCYYSHPQAIEILKDIRKNCKIDILHIDNVDPQHVITDKGIEITKAIVQYCTEGNTAAFGVESFDPVVVKENCLNSDPETTYKAVKLINKYGSERGSSGLPRFLPGINLLFGLINESKETNTHNMTWLKKILDENLLLRRINIRQVDIFQGTPLYLTVGNKFIKKNKKFYWKWRNDIRQHIDFPMLQKIAPAETILKNVYAEIYDGNTTFGRQLGTYPLIVGIKGRIDLKKFYNVKVTQHRLRSVTGEVMWLIP